MGSAGVVGPVVVGCMQCAFHAVYMCCMHAVNSRVPIVCTRVSAENSAKPQYLSRPHQKAAESYGQALQQPCCNCYIRRLDKLQSFDGIILCVVIPKAVWMLIGPN